VRRSLTALLGVLHDHALADGGASFERALRMGIEDSLGGGGEIDVLARTAQGSPLGSSDSVRQAFRDLSAEGVVAVLGPAITDNALAILPQVDELMIPTINYTGSERARSEFMFHYQVGSLETEPYVIARHLATRGLTRVGLVQERSFIGEQLAAFLEDACRRHQLELLVTTTLAEDGHDAAEAVAAVRERVPDAILYLGLGMSARPLSLATAELQLPVLTNSALMFGYAMPEWTAGWEGWVYVDAVSDDNSALAGLREQWGDGFPSGPGVPSAYDMGRLVAEGIAHAPRLDGAGVKQGLELVKHLPAALGKEGTTMGFGRWERSALKGEFLLLRAWRGGVSVPWSTSDGR